jgi:hypothetical protein
MLKIGNPEHIIKRSTISIISYLYDNNKLLVSTPNVKRILRRPQGSYLLQGSDGSTHP